MFLSILKTTFNNLHRDRLYSFINILGLSISFCCFLIIVLYLYDELSYDQHFEQHENIFRLNTEVIMDGVSTYHAQSGSPLGSLLTENYAGLESYVRLERISTETAVLFINGDINLQWQNVYNVDGNLFDVFSHSIVSGDPSLASTQTRSIGVSESFAKLYFGNEDPVGKTINVQAVGNEFTITLVFADLPANTSLKYDVIFFSNTDADTGTDQEILFEKIVEFDSYTYLLVNENFKLDDFSVISDDFFNRYGAEGALRMFPNQQARMDYTLQSLDEIYLSAPLREDLPSGSMFNIYILSGIAIFVLFIAGINYMNLATARSVKRAKEVGVRRTLGAGKLVIATQFLTESLVFSVLSLLIGISLTELLLATDIVSNFLGKELSFFLINDAALLAQVTVLSVVLGLLAGSYPAIYFSSVKPIEAFKSAPTLNSRGISLRTILISLQMLVSIAVIAGTLVMNSQVSYMKNRPLGFDKENKMYITLHAGVNDSEVRALMVELSRHSNVSGVTMADIIPGTQTMYQPALMEDDEGRQITQQVNFYIVDESYLPVLDIELVQGRNFSENYGNSNDYNLYDYIVNESFVKMMGWNNPIGKRIQYPLQEVSGEVIGVINDFNYAPLHQQLSPLVLEPYYQDYRWQRHIIVDVSADNFQQTLAYIEPLMKAFEPDSALEYHFIEQTLDLLYTDEQKQMQLIGIGSAMCIFISILGLLGLTSFAIDQKTKEIGIMKAMGASTSRILLSLFSNIFIVILVAAVLATIFDFYILSRWLEGFAYRIDINPLTFLLATMAVLLMALIILLIHGYKISLNRPVNALRYE